MSSLEDMSVRGWDTGNCPHKISTNENVKLAASNLSDTKLLPHHAINPCHIHFSSVPSHALCNSEQLLGGHGMQEYRQPWAQLVKFHQDGWIKGPNGRLLLWIPVTFRQPFYSMWTTRVIPTGCCIELDLSHMVHGHIWHKCYKSVP
ncbi:hypothetical protein EDC04DRAFT_3068327 [Pisolithus marmoratus]|nr:hypothetical protein EDC04DRAFT_3068327 [Pisolithus marmoratus]